MREQHDRQLQEVRGEVETIYERQVRWTFNIHTVILDLFIHPIIPLDRFVKWVENFKEHNCIFWEDTLAACYYRYAWWNSWWKQCWPCILSMQYVWDLLEVFFFFFLQKKSTRVMWLIPITFYCRWDLWRVPWTEVWVDLQLLLMRLRLQGRESTRCPLNSQS